MSQQSSDSVADRLLVQSVVGALDSPENAELVQLCNEYNEATNQLHVQPEPNDAQLRVNIGQRLLDACALPANERKLQESEQLSNDLRRRTDELSKEAEKAKIQMTINDERQRLQMDEQITHFKAKVQHQHAMCKDFERRLASIGFNTAITDEAITTLIQENERLSLECKELRNDMRKYQLREYKNEELVQRIEALKFELLEYENFFETSQNEY